MISFRGQDIREAEAESALPPGMVAYDLGAETLLLHTIQRPEAVQDLFTTGTLKADMTLACPENREAYAWMHAQMATRLPTSGDGILWLWARTTREKLVRQCRISPGEVLLTCRIPRETALLSNYDGWNAVLSTSPIPAPALPHESPKESFERVQAADSKKAAWLIAAGATPTTPMEGWPGEVLAKVKQSWENIFDLGYYGLDDDWQATMHELHVEDVVDAVLIINLSANDPSD